MLECVLFFFFKQKTAYEMRISDWSSDVCSSDLQGKDHVEVTQAIPGDIAAVAKVDDLHFDAVLHDSYAQDHIHLAPLDFPRPMFGLAIDAGSKGQEPQLATALHKLADEDPCFQVEHLPDTNESVIRIGVAGCRAGVWT